MYSILTLRLYTKYSEDHQHHVRRVRLFEHGGAASTQVGHLVLSFCLPNQKLSTRFANAHTLEKCQQSWSSLLNKQARVPRVSRRYKDAEDRCTAHDSSLTELAPCYQSIAGLVYLPGYEISSMIWSWPAEAMPASLSILTRQHKTSRLRH